MLGFKVDVYFMCSHIICMSGREQASEDCKVGWHEKSIVEMLFSENPDNIYVDTSVI